MDDILEDRPVELRFETEQAACSFVHDAESLGADCSSDDRSTCARADEPEPEDAG